jgi:hypothetical protein
MAGALVTYDGPWLVLDEDETDCYDPDWYPPIAAPHSQQMWADYLDWAQSNLFVIEHSPLAHHFAKYPQYNPFHNNLIGE